MNRENLERKEGAAGRLPIILASASPRRRELLSQIGLAFEVDKSDAQECPHSAVPEEIVRELSFAKAQEVFQRRRQGREGLLVIGADTLVYCKGEIIGKPKDRADALRILKKLNGSWQSVYTGVCVMNLQEQKMLFGHDVSKCKARRLSPQELEHLAGKHMDKAGAYAVQDTDDPFIERIVGSRSNVVGFPVEFFQKLFKEFLAL